MPTSCGKQAEETRQGNFGSCVFVLSFCMFFRTNSGAGTNGTGTGSSRLTRFAVKDHVDELAVGYSLAGCAAAESATASPARAHLWFDTPRSPAPHARARFTRVTFFL